MSAFEFYFSFYGLILGLSVVEVVTGLVRTLKQRQRVRIGWLTPMLGLFVLLDLVSFWSMAWSAMQDVEVSYGLLLLGLVIATIYFAAASLVTPDDLEQWPDFGVFYDQHKAYVLTGVLIANLLAVEGVGILFLTEDWLAAVREPSYWWTRGGNNVFLIALIFIRHRRVNIALLSFGIAMFGVTAAIS